MRSTKQRAHQESAVSDDEGLLSQDRIVSLAKRLIETTGLESITMRRLADELGVTPMALYHHVPNKQVLLALVSDAVVGSADFPGPEVGPWYERMRLSVLKSYQELNRFPGLGQYHLGGDRFSKSGMRIMQKEIEVLIEAGFDEEEALAAVYLTLTYIGGDFLTKGGAHRDHAQPLFSLDERGEISLKSKRGSKHLVSQTQAFLRGLDTIIAGLRAQLAAKQALVAAASNTRSVHSPKKSTARASRKK